MSFPPSLKYMAKIYFQLCSHLLKHTSAQIANAKGLNQTASQAR
jgi:hypothetical protein